MSPPPEISTFITALESLTPNQARYVCLLIMKEAAAYKGDIDNFAACMLGLDLVIHDWTKEEANDLAKRCDLIHISIGCCDSCKHKQGGADGERIQ